MCLGYAEKDGGINDRIVAYFAARARGGVGLVLTGYTFVDDKMSRSGPTQMGAHSDHLIPGLRRLAQAVQKEGAKIFLQLVHGGRQADVALFGERRVAPSSVGTDVIPAPTELTVEQIEEIIEAFGRAARRAREAGFDGVEAHGAHGYLIGEFMSDFTNLRTDEWGGDFERRMRFPLQVVARIKQKCGADFPVGFRLSGDEYLRLMDEKLADRGVTVPVAQRIAHTMQKAAVAYLSVSACVAETAFTALQPLYWPRGFNLHLARAVKEAVSIPVVAAGSIIEPEMAEEVVGAGKADMVAMGRALIADPEWPNKANGGRAQDIRPCIRCCECSVKRDEQPYTRCAVNVELGREGEPKAQKAARPRRVAVVGGGPAGMEAALQAAAAGHHVTLFEKSDALGGNLRPASAPSFKADLRRLMDYYSRQLAKAGVDVRLGCPFDEAAAKEIAPVVVVLALGTVAAAPEIAGADGRNVHQAIDVLNGAAEVKGKTVAVIGGGTVGCEVGLFLAQKGRQVTVLEMLPAILAEEDVGANKVVLSRLLDENGVKIVVNAKATAIRPGKVLALVGGQETPFAAEEVVLATGMKPAAEPDLGRVQADVVRVGDGRPPGDVFDAVHAGAEALAL
jgi:2,4-dienoyl-CoA reductase-like NADH-dependent reductase (Old Yellow Enzyme family)/thioredoxin reductase